MPEWLRASNVATARIMQVFASFQEKSKWIIP
jgi:hypothetical protein